MPIEPSHGASPPAAFGRATWIAGSIPLLGMLAVFVGIGWGAGFWVPLGIVLATSALFLLTFWTTRRGRHLLRTDPDEGRRMLNAQADRVGRAMGLITIAWIALSILFAIAFLASRL